MDFFLGGGKRGGNDNVLELEGMVAGPREYSKTL